MNFNTLQRRLVERYDIDVPSDRIRFALEAMQWWEKQPDAGIKMHRYRNIQIASKGESSTYACFACCGGVTRSIMEGWNPAEVIKLTGTVTREFNSSSVTALESSLDDARVGCLKQYLYWFDLTEEQDEAAKLLPEHITICHYSLSSEQFYTDMLNLADSLEELGL